jgi:hypothetical protein
MSVGSRTAPLSEPRGLATAVLVGRRGPAEGWTWSRRFLLTGLFLLGLWALLAASADAARADPPEAGEQADEGMPWPPDADVVVPPDTVPADPPAEDSETSPPPAEPSALPPVAPEPPAVVPPGPPSVIVVAAVADVAAPPPPDTLLATDLPTEAAGEPAAEVVLAPLVPEIAAPPVTVEPAQLLTSGPAQSSVPAAPCPPPPPGVSGPRDPADRPAPSLVPGSTEAVSPSPAAGIGAPAQPLVPVPPPPVHLPVQAPPAPVGPTSATASGSSSCGTGHGDPGDLVLAVVDSTFTASPAGSSARPTSGFPAAVVGGANDPGDRPD